MFALDEMPSGYTPEQAFHVLDAYGMAGRNAYRFLLLTIDLIFPFLYGSFLFSIDPMGGKQRFNFRVLGKSARSDWIHRDLLRLAGYKCFVSDPHEGLPGGLPNGAWRSWHQGSTVNEVRWRFRN